MSILAWVNTCVLKKDYNSYIQEIVDKKWDTLMQKMQNETPKGEIRFFGFNKGRFVKELSVDVIDNFGKNIPRQDLESMFSDKYIGSKMVCEYLDIWGTEGSSFGLYKECKTIYEIGKSIFFYANDVDVEDKLVVERLFRVWIEKYVMTMLILQLEDAVHKKSISNLCSCRLKAYYTPLVKALERFGIALTDDESHSIIEYLAKEHGLKVINMARDNNNLQNVTIIV